MPCRKNDKKSSNFWRLILEQFVVKVLDHILIFKFLNCLINKLIVMFNL